MSNPYYEARDAADLAAPWGGYQWKVRELIDRAQAAEADYRRALRRVATLESALKRIARPADYDLYVIDSVETARRALLADETPPTCPPDDVQCSSLHGDDRTRIPHWHVVYAKDPT